jgi:carbon monoxide dehydrogenase subunit G
MILVERDLAAPPARVWACMSDLDRWAELLPTVEGITRVGAPGPIAVGTRFTVRQPGLATAEYAVTEWRPETGFTWEATAKGVHTAASHELRPTGTGTRLVLGIAWSGSGAWLAKAFFTRKTRDFLRREASAFADLAEHASG